MRPPPPLSTLFPYTTLFRSPPGTTPSPFSSPPGRCGSRRRAPGECSSRRRGRSEEHTSELQSRLHLVCRLLLEKKKFQLVVANYLKHLASSCPCLQLPLL